MTPFDPSQLRIGFAGTPEFSATVLSHLIDAGFPIHVVYTQPDKPKGRGKKITQSPVKVLAEEKGITVEQPKTLRSEEAISELRAYDLDVLIVVAYGLILPKEVLEAPTYGCLNIHASILPEWRGAAPIQRAILRGDETTGVTIMKMDEGLDTGDMVLISTCDIADNDTSATLHDKLSHLGANAILDVIADLPNQLSKATPQDNNIATYAEKMSKQEALINWEVPACDIERLIRAFNPWPMAFFKLNDENVRVWEATVHPHEPTQEAGLILAVSPNGLLVSTGQDALLLTKLQLPGGKPLSFKDIYNSKKSLFQEGAFLSQ